MFQDIHLICICGNSFVWTAGEQKFLDGLQERGKFDSEDSDGNILPGTVKQPRRCKPCRIKKRQDNERY